MSELKDFGFDQYIPESYYEENRKYLEYTPPYYMQGKLTRSQFVRWYGLMVEAGEWFNGITFIRYDYTSYEKRDIWKADKLKKEADTVLRDAYKEYTEKQEKKQKRDAYQDQKRSIINNILNKH